MPSWLKKYWPALLFGALLLTLLDAVISSLITCHPPVAGTSNQPINGENPEQCTALHGPMLLTLSWIIGFIDDHGDIFIAAFTAVLAVFTARLWWATDKLWKAGEIHSERELRAYVGIEYAEIKIEDGKKLIAIVDYKNSGQTPAHDVDLRLSAQVFNFADKFLWQTPGAIEDEGKGGVILPSLTWRRYREMKGIGDDFAALISALADEKKRIWVWGTISYRDIFDKRCEVQFCFWSSKIRRSKKRHEWFATIPDIANTKATYGKD
jgi:hypothetical protein